MSDPIQLFKVAIAAAGLTPPRDLVADGAIHRFSSNGQRGDDSGWYVLHLDGLPGGKFGCWRAGFVQAWSCRSADDLTPDEREAHRHSLAALRMEREADLLQQHRQATEKAAARWHAASPCIEHPYLAAKGVQAYGLRAEGTALLIRMMDAAGTLHSLQEISTEGDKRFQKHGRVKGCYFGIGKPAGILIICEGYATGASIHEATGHAVAVAFNAGNLLKVTRALNQKYPALSLVLAADDDWQTAGNPGVTKAAEAARAVGGCLALPLFPPGRQEGDTDFNDLHRLAGLIAVQQCFMNILENLA